MPAFVRTPLLLALALLVGCTGEDIKDGETGVDTEPADADGDGFTTVDDCDDTDALVFPGAAELCNDRDDDCDHVADEDATDRTTLYADTDGDGHGNADAPFESCDTPAGYVTTSDDCNDTDATISPSATEVCDGAGVDEDCNTLADDADAGVDVTTATTFYADADADGYGDAAAPAPFCELPAGYAATADDCDDANFAVHPAATEICDAADVDDDCDGASDDLDDDLDVSTVSTWYLDADSDGYGTAGASVGACDMPVGYVADATDCDDAVTDVNPAATELCDDLDVDEDCDGGADNADPGAFGEATWYADADGDGFGDAATTMSACDLPELYVADDTDCDDTSAAVYPSAPEHCDGAANDCDTMGTWTADAEAGTASWVDDAGAWTVVTDTLAAGTADAPVAWTAPSDGELRVCDGTFYAVVDGSGADLVLTGQNGAETTVIDGGGTGTVISSTGGTLTVSGVTVRNGAGSNGGGLYCLATDLTVEDAVFESNSATGSGGGLFLQACADATLVDTRISGNTAVSGGGLYATTSDGLILEGVEITENTVTSTAGGVVLSNSDFSIADSTVSRNTAGASYAAGGLSIASSTGTLDTVVVADNTAMTAAGMLVSVSTVDITGGEVSTNTASSYGGAIHAYYTSTLTANGTTFNGNISGNHAAVYLDTNVSASFTGCTFWMNLGATAGALAFAGTSAATITTSDFSDNSPYDAFAAGTGYSFGMAASATCDDATGCY